MADTVSAEAQRKILEREDVIVGYVAEFVGLAIDHVAEKFGLERDSAAFVPARSKCCQDCSRRVDRPGHRAGGVVDVGRRGPSLQRRRRGCDFTG